jgi:hypothetical protein
MMDVLSKTCRSSGFCLDQANVGLGKLFDELYRSIYLNYDEMIACGSAVADGEKPLPTEPNGLAAQEAGAAARSTAEPADRHGVENINFEVGMTYARQGRVVGRVCGHTLASFTALRDVLLRRPFCAMHNGCVPESKGTIGTSPSASGSKRSWPLSKLATQKQNAQHQQPLLFSHAAECCLSVHLVFDSLANHSNRRHAFTSLRAKSQNMSCSGSGLLHSLLHTPRAHSILFFPHAPLLQRASCVCIT